MVAALSIPVVDRAIDAIWNVLRSIPDPEIPVISICDLGIVRDVIVHGVNVEVVITPTYSGCPAMHAIEEDIRGKLAAAGFADARITTVLSPAWTTDWMSEAGRANLRKYGIAPPSTSGPETTVVRFVTRRHFMPACPHCGSDDTERLSEFGSTACKALYRCVECREPFDYFKAI